MSRFLSKGLSSFLALPVLALTVGLLLGCAVPARNAHGLPAERVAQLEGICTDTMKFPRGDVRFDECMDALSETAKTLHGVERAQ
jgi:hypothetical protein